MNLWNLAGKFYLTMKFKGAVFATQKVDKALYLEIDLKAATQKKRSGLVVREHLFLLALLNILKR